ncbi:MAG TPA: ATP-binding protein [Anaerolineales bacterium]|nr:ATP-binding protein [Anaerolineales bacterium]
MLIAAMDPCPCGWRNDPQKACGFASALVTKYQKRISGPLLDRIDIHIEVPRADYEKLSGDLLGESSESIRKRVQAARDLQLPVGVGCHRRWARNMRHCGNHCPDASQGIKSHRHCSL